MECINNKKFGWLHCELLLSLVTTWTPVDDWRRWICIDQAFPNSNPTQAVSRSKEIYKHWIYSRSSKLKTTAAVDTVGSRCAVCALILKVCCFDPDPIVNSERECATARQQTAIAFISFSIYPCVEREPDFREEPSLEREFTGECLLDWGEFAGMCCQMRLSMFHVATCQQSNLCCTTTSSHTSYVARGILIQKSWKF